MFALSGLLVARICGAAGWSASELSNLLKNHINDRLYNTCKTVVLEQQSETGYAGYAEFHNGVQVGLEVSVSGGRIEYAFVKPQSERDAGATTTEIEQLQAIITHQQIEIARLRDLCAHAGIDAETIEADTVLIATEPTDPASEPDASSSIVDSQTSSEPAPIWCTRPAYDGIRKGMTRAQVAEKLGAEGRLISNSDFDRAINETYVWANPDDSHACIVFRNGKVLVKTQFGLPTAPPPADHSK
jgi:hypothetical protein